MEAVAHPAGAVDLGALFCSAATGFSQWPQLCSDPMDAAFTEIAAPATGQRVLDTLTVTSMPSTSLAGAGVTS